MKRQPMQANLLQVYDLLSHRGTGALFVATTLTLLAGCATPQPTPTLRTSTRFSVFIPSGATGYKMESNQNIVLGPAITQLPPVYPAALVTRRLPPQHVCLAVAIDKQGNVSRTQPLYSVDGCPAPAAVPAVFVTAAQAAATHWRFLPTHLCTFPKGVDASKQGTNCLEEGAKVQRLAISLAFDFTFSIESGMPHVTTRSMHSSQGTTRTGADKR